MTNGVVSTLRGGGQSPTVDPCLYQGSITVLVGVSQFLLAFAFGPGQPATVAVLFGGGSLLVGIGVNRLWDRDAFEGWASNRLRMALRALLAVAVFGASVFVLISG